MIYHKTSFNYCLRKNNAKTEAPIIPMWSLLSFLPDVYAILTLAVASKQLFIIFSSIL